MTKSIYRVAQKKKKHRKGGRVFFFWVMDVEGMHLWPLTLSPQMFSGITHHSAPYEVSCAHSKRKGLTLKMDQRCIQSLVVHFVLTNRVAGYSTIGSLGQILLTDGPFLDRAILSVIQSIEYITELRLKSSFHPGSPFLPFSLPFESRERHFKNV